MMRVADTPGPPGFGKGRLLALPLAFAIVVGSLCGMVSVARAQFPRIQFRAFAGVPSSTGADSVVDRKVTIRWVRDRAAEARPDFGGYRIYRVATVRDTSRMELLRRFARPDTLLWHFPDDQDTLQFVDPDSIGNLVKVCRIVDSRGGCVSRGDSVYKLIPPPGPHDGYALYYTIVYGSIDQTRRETEEMFVPDTTNQIGPCLDPLNRYTCPNLNNRATNLMLEPVFVTGPSEADLEQVIVVPNPYRGSERWDQPGVHRVQFQNLPASATVRVYTVAGDLVRVLEHANPLSSSLDWDLRNAHGDEVSPGIYVFHVQSGQGFELKGHFVVVR